MDKDIKVITYEMTIERTNTCEMCGCKLEPSRSLCMPCIFQLYTEVQEKINGVPALRSEDV